jgi:hypothetical protein
MARKLDRQEALKLRQQGKSYSQIKEALNLSKSTLSLWLKKYPLSKEQIDNLRGKNPKRIEKFRETMRLKHNLRLQNIYNKKSNTLLPLSNKELLVAGLFLYWGEGSKTTGNVSINNTDPDVLKFTLFWFCNVLKIPKDKIKVYLHLYKDMSSQQEIKFWSDNLKIPISQFAKPYIKSSNRENLTHKGFGHGTCGLTIHKINIKEDIMMSIKAISDYYSSKI